MSNQVCADLDSALVAIDAFTGRPDEFELLISNTLHDPFGVTMAVITDRGLGRSWWPEGFEQRDGYRLYRYSSAASAGNQQSV
ncbi:hypothetical protein [Xanthomonas sp. WHRI 8932A]|uniref:hypothetical protein n=1 Tax=unclassified Xanthomonas TaxID=2643310 RepID=UPI002B2356C7|nr:hypothetical protein [Xanthomonas sp. WHRI 8932A]MEA9566265.1 hypothetical protein [Xanthomonas sp. WHRI 8932A]